MNSRENEHASDDSAVTQEPRSVSRTHHPAAFINAIAEEGTKAEAVEWLQRQWNENCELRKLNAEMLAALETCADLLWSYGGDQSSEDGWKTEELRDACLAARAAIAKAEGKP